ncbi:MAG: hypothetical protein WAW92_03395 [Minisyncoccia bacterium]
MNQTEEARYNLICFSCGSVFQPLPRTSLWWQAKQRAERGFIDALCISAEECGCAKKEVRPDALFRVTGYDGMCDDYDVPFSNFVSAVKYYKDAVEAGDVVFIVGVSKAVQDRIQWGA